MLFLVVGTHGRHREAAALAAPTEVILVRRHILYQNRNILNATAKFLGSKSSTSSTRRCRA